MSKTDAMVGYYPIDKLPQGADVKISLNYKAGTPPVTVDVSSYTAKMQVRKNYNSPVLIELTNLDGTIILAATSPNIVLFFKKELTENIGSYEEMIYDLEITDVAGLTTRLMEGPITISKQVTK